MVTNVRHDALDFEMGAFDLFFFFNPILFYNKNIDSFYIRPCQIEILLSVRVRVGFTVLNLIKNKFVGELFLNNSDFPGFRKNITIL